MTISNSNLRGRLVDASIDFHRAVLNIRPVDLDSMPGWFAARVNWSVGHGWGRSDAWHSLMNTLDRRAGHRIFDHHGASTDQFGRSVYVTEPYADPDDEAFQQAVAAVACTLGIHARILGPWQSWWLPGSTIRVEFSECPASPLCPGCKSREQLRDESRARKQAARKGVLHG